MTKQGNGEGRNPICKDCGNFKEEKYKNAAYCGKCKGIREKARYEKKRELSGLLPRKTGRNTNCSKCGELKTGSYVKESVCNKCKNAYRHARSPEVKPRSCEWGKGKKTCNKCGGLKEETFLKDAYCRLCHNQILREKNASKRAEKGLPAWGSGELTPFCSKCGGVKEEGYKNGGYCRTCKLTKQKQETAQRRHSLGLGQWGSGDKPVFCYRCKKTKENRERKFCYECKAILDSQGRFRRVATEEGKEKERLLVRKKLQDKDFYMKVAARRALNTYVWLGKIKKQPCEICGKEKADAHHDDYMKPLDVRWLCRKHHMEYHNSKETRF